MTHTEAGISADPVREPLRDQHPDPADRSVELGARGGDNRSWRLGDDLAAAWLPLPAGAVGRFHQACRPAPDDATLRRARGRAVLHALSCVRIGDAGAHGGPGGKSTWGPSGHAAPRRRTATAASHGSRGVPSAGPEGVA
ncbi:hypothetical protein ACIPRD_12445 [Streptomyces sp. NPDC090108]|uniref:hypothetical protein n=1 Tax=Streptomyces sp. NPDC090108 TaxID=3365947 RepID=UPI00380ADBCC